MLSKLMISKVPVGHSSSSRVGPGPREAPASERLAGRKRQRHLVQVGTMGNTLCGVMAHSRSENIRMEGGRLMLLSHARQVVSANPPASLALEL